jgi:hypothetical protein
MPIEAPQLAEEKVATGTADRVQSWGADTEGYPVCVSKDCHLGIRQPRRCADAFPTACSDHRNPGGGNGRLAK